MQKISSLYLVQSNKQKRQVVIALGLVIVPLIIYFFLQILLAFILSLSLWSDFANNKKYTKVPDYVGLIIITLLVATLLIPVYGLLRAVWKVGNEYKMAKDLDNIEDLPNKFVPLIENRINLIEEKLPTIYKDRLTKYSIKYFLERRNHSSIPCMIAFSNSINIILPLGFFKLIKTDPNVADAILVHELAHFFHNDYKSLLIVRSFLKAGYVFNLFIIFSVFRYTTLLLIIPSILYTRFLTGFLRKRLEKAEELADFLAIIIIGPEPVRKFLTDYIDENSTFNITFMEAKSSWLNQLSPAVWADFDNNISFHPTVKARLAQVDIYEKNQSQVRYNAEKLLAEKAK